MQNIFLTTNNELKKADILRDISSYYLEIDSDSSLLYSQKGLELSEKLKYSLGIAANSAMIGDNYIRLDSLEKARYYYSQAVDAFEKTDNPSTYSKVLLVLGNIYFVTNNYPEALNAYQKSMKVCEENGYDQTLAHLHNNIGSIYLEMDNLDKALENIEAAYKGFQKIEEELYSAQALVSLAIVHRRLQEYNKALNNLNNALEIFRDLNDLENIAEANRIIGLIYRDKEEYEKALSYFNEAFTIISRKDIQSIAPKSIILSTIYLNLSQVNYHLKEYGKANKLAHQSLEIANANRYVKTISDSYMLLSQINEKMLRIDSAYKYLKLHKIYSDSVMNENAIEKITQLQLEYGFAKKISERELVQSLKDAEQNGKNTYILLQLFL